MFPEKKILEILDFSIVFAKQQIDCLIHNAEKKLCVSSHKAFLHLLRHPS